MYNSGKGVFMLLISKNSFLGIIPGSVTYVIKRNKNVFNKNPI